MTTAKTLTPTKSETKAERTTAAALEIIEAQTIQRQEKSERLRQARLAQEVEPKTVTKAKTKKARADA